MFLNFPESGRTLLAREVEEFTNGLRRMKGGARSKDILDMLKRLRTSLSQAEALQHDVECPGWPRALSVLCPFIAAFETPLLRMLQNLCTE